MLTPNSFVVIQLSTPRKWSVKLKLLEDRSGQKYISKFDVREENNWSRGEFVDQFNKMYETMDIAAMTPEEREHVEWAIEFILSTESMGDFWNFEQETSFYVDKIMALLKKPRGGSNSLAAKKYQLIIKPLVEAISAHEEAVTSILTTDRLNGTVEIAPLLLPQRQILLQWKWVFPELSLFLWVYAMEGIRLRSFSRIALTIRPRHTAQKDYTDSETQCSQGTRIFIYHLKNKLDVSRPFLIFDPNPNYS